MMRVRSEMAVLLLFNSFGASCEETCMGQEVSHWHEIHHRYRGTLSYVERTGGTFILMEKLNCKGEGVSHISRQKLRGTQDRSGLCYHPASILEQQSNR